MIFDLIAVMVASMFFVGFIILTTWLFLGNEIGGPPGFTVIDRWIKK